MAPQVDRAPADRERIARSHDRPSESEEEGPVDPDESGGAANTIPPDGVY
jgi:hypothetical protein